MESVGTFRLLCMESGKVNQVRNDMNRRRTETGTEWFNMDSFCPNQRCHFSYFHFLDLLLVGIMKSACKFSMYTYLIMYRSLISLKCPSECF